MENAKMLILNNRQDVGFKAVLNLKNNSPSSIKFYNLSPSFKTLALGIKQENNVAKVPLIVQENSCEFLLPESINLSNKLFCAVVNITNAFCPEVVLCGSLNTDSENTKIESAFIAKKSQNNTNLYEPSSNEEIENLIDKNLQEDATSTYYDCCSNCKYRKAFYEQTTNEINLDTQNNAQNRQNKQQNVNLNNSATNNQSLNLAEFNKQNDYNFINKNASNLCLKSSCASENCQQENSKNLLNLEQKNTLNYCKNNSNNLEENNTLTNQNYIEIKDLNGRNLEETSNTNFNSVEKFNDAINEKSKEINRLNCKTEGDNISSNNNTLKNINNETNKNSNENSSLNNKNLEENLTFYEQIKPQFEALFSKNPEEETLNNLISNSKWVKVCYEENNYYVLGLIYAEETKQVEYIAYGMPSNNSQVPPEELKDYAQWLPLINSQTENFLGYWIAYQSALTGETIKITFI